MTLLVDRMGQPPQERWNLFKEYYNLIYQREIERGIPAAEILRDHKADIDSIHRRVGLFLQVESERSGGTDARLSTNAFAALVKGYLREEGHRDPGLEDLAQKVIDAAAQRLVFLVGLESGKVGFEIRSLQEFMAAEGLVEAEDPSIQSRLREIAPVSNWRNVFLFAAGKCFVERRYLRDTIVQICTDLNDEADNALSRITLAGSRLALDLLEDGPAARHPTTYRVLVRLALQLLDVDDVEIFGRLSNVLSPEAADIYNAEITTRLERAQIRVHDTDIRGLILRVADVHGADFDGLARQASVQGTASQQYLEQLLSLSDGRPGFVRNAIVAMVPQLGPGSLSQAFARRERLDIWRPEADAPHWVRAIQNWERIVSSGSRAVRLPILNKDGRQIGEAFGKSAVPLSDGPDPGTLSTMPDPSPAWLLLQSIWEMNRAPSESALATVIELGGRVPPRELFYVSNLAAPWPVAHALYMASRSESWTVAAESARRGDFGDPDAWIRFEEDSSSGLVVSNVFSDPTFPVGGLEIMPDTVGADLSELLDAYEAGTEEARESPAVYWMLQSAVFRFHRRVKARKQPAPVWVRRLVALLLRQGAIYAALEALTQYEEFGINDTYWDEVVSSFELSEVAGPSLFRESDDQLWQMVVAAHHRNPDRNLLPALGIAAQVAQPNAQFPPIPMPSSDATDADRVAWALVEMRRGISLRRLAPDLLPTMETLPDAAAMVVQTIRAMHGEGEGAVEDLIELQRIAPSRDANAARAYLHNIGLHRRSRLHDLEVWGRLGLPSRSH